MLSRVRYTGEPLVPLADQYPRSVGFLLAEEGGPPIGTGFLVGYQLGKRKMNNLPFVYLVTARHVAENAGWLRINRDWLPSHIVGSYEGVLELPIGSWIHHEGGADVSVSPIQRQPRLRTINIPSYQFVQLGPGPRHFVFAGDADPLEKRQPLLGDRIYFIGLIEHMQSMVKRNVPMVRSGTLGAMYEPGVPIRLEDGTEDEYGYQSHLVDCRLLKGYSGSPCFIQHEEFVEQKVVRHTRLLGVMGAYFNAPISAQGEVQGGGSLPITLSLNAGIGVVVPSEAIIEVIELPVLMEDREKQKEQRAKEEEAGGAELASSEGGKPEEFKRFEKLARTVLSVPKDEVNKREQERKKRGDS